SACATTTAGVLTSAGALVLLSESTSQNWLAARAAPSAHRVGLNHCSPRTPSWVVVSPLRLFWPERSSLPALCFAPGVTALPLTIPCTASSLRINEESLGV